MVSIKDLLLHGGLSKEQYDLVKQDVIEENERFLRLYAPIACIVFLVLYVLSIVMGGFPASNNSIYQKSCIAMGILSFTAHLFTRNHPRLILPLMYLFAFVLYAFSIGVSMNHVGYPAVSATVVLTIMPLLLFDIPIRVGLGTVFATVALCLMTSVLKTPDLAYVDIWNAITFGAVALVCSGTIMRVRFQSAYRAYKVAYLSETDTLTKLKNRNCFEERVETYPRKAKETIVCVYADANGLHELNNTQGHAAGDLLLRDIANELAETFDSENSYRIGGDEFVVLLVDRTESEVREQCRTLYQHLAQRGHFVSYGIAQGNKPHLDMQALIREAEVKMYEYKPTVGSERSRMSHPSS